MNRFDWKFPLVGAAMLAAAAAAVALTPARTQHGAAGFDLERIIPSSFGDWSIDPLMAPIVPAPDVRANLALLYDQIVSRTYVNNRGERMMLTIAYDSHALRVSRQEECYAAQGFEIRKLVHGDLRLWGKTIPVTRILAVRGARSEPVTYWFTMGADRVVLGRLQRRMMQLRYKLSGRLPDGMLVRVSNISANPTRAFEAHEEFAAALLGGMRRGDVHRLLGSRSS
jgi:EpsI family protein